MSENMRIALDWYKNLSVLEKETIDILIFHRIYDQLACAIVQTCLLKIGMYFGFRYHTKS